MTNRNLLSFLSAISLIISCQMVKKSSALSDAHVDPILQDKQISPERVSFLKLISMNDGDTLDVRIKGKTVDNAADPHREKCLENTAGTSIDLEWKDCSATSKQIWTIKSVLNQEIAGEQLYDYMNGLLVYQAPTNSGDSFYHLLNFAISPEAVSLAAEIKSLEDLLSKKNSFNKNIKISLSMAKDRLNRLDVLGSLTVEKLGNEPTGTTLDRGNGSERVAVISNTRLNVFDHLTHYVNRSESELEECVLSGKDNCNWESVEVYALQHFITDRLDQSRYSCISKSLSPGKISFKQIFMGSESAQYDNDVTECANFNFEEVK